MKKLFVFATLLLSVFTLAGCEKEDLTELHNAIDNMNNITNAKVTITSEAAGIELVITEYLTEEAIVIEVGETFFTSAITMYSVIDGDNVHIISNDLLRSDSPYTVIETVSLSDYEDQLGDYNIFKEGDFKKDGDYYVAKKVDFDVEGYEDVDEIKEIKVKVEDGYMTEIIMIMDVEGQEVTASLKIEEIGEVSVILPPYFGPGVLEDFESQLVALGHDWTIFNNGFEVIGNNYAIMFNMQDSIVVVDSPSDDITYDIINDTFTVNETEYSYDDYFANYSSPFTKASFNLVKELLDIYV